VSVTSSAGAAALARLRELFATYPEVNERPSHHTPTFFVRDKKVLCHLWDSHHDDGLLAIWCAAPQGVQGELVDREPERFFVPKYVGHRGWIGVRLDVDLDWDEIDEILRDAYRLVAPKTLSKLLNESATES
jgi:hypothetical protein